MGLFWEAEQGWPRLSVGDVTRHWRFQNEAVSGCFGGIQGQV